MSQMKPAAYLHLVAPVPDNVRDDNKPTLCRLDWKSLFYDQAISVAHVDKLRTETRPYPLCPNCDQIFSDQAAGREYRIGYKVGNEQENRTEYLDGLFTEEDAQRRVASMRSMESGPSVRGGYGADPNFPGGKIDSKYFYERRPCLGCETPGQIHDVECIEWQGWVIWTKHNRRDYTVRGRTRDEAYAALTREAEKFAPDPLIQDLHLPLVRNVNVHPTMRDIINAISPDVPVEFADWGPRPDQRRGIEQLRQLGGTIPVPPQNFGKALTPDTMSGHYAQMVGRSRRPGISDLTVDDIKQMSADALDVFLNKKLLPFFAEHGMGTRDRHYSVNSGDASDAKTALRKLGFKFKFGEFGPDSRGCCAAFSRQVLPAGRYWVESEVSEEMATARAAAIAIVERPHLFEPGADKEPPLIHLSHERWASDLAIAIGQADTGSVIVVSSEAEKKAALERIESAGRKDELTVKTY